MTNQEVNEFMQRYLDDDLSKDELEALLEHIRLSPESALVFDRLQRLDNELEQLPKVVPPISIVDSILPRLELAGLVDQSPVTGTESDDNISNRVVPLERKLTLRERVNVKWLGGVVAAGVVLTLFLTNFGPQSNNDLNTADEAIQSMDSTAVAINNAPAARRDNTAVAETSDDVNNMMRVEDQYGAASPDVATEAPTANVTSAPKTTMNHSESDVSGSEAGESETARSEQAPWVDQGALAFTGTEDRIQSLTNEAQEPAGDNQMLTATSSLPDIVSPDEQLKGTVSIAAEGGQQIIITDTKDNVIYKSAVYSGILNELTWSPDSSQLHFEITEDGIPVVHMTIYVTEQTESQKIVE